jgi:hypothetical protein
MEFDIVTGINDGTNAGRVNDLIEPCQKPGSTYAARKHDCFVRNVIV